MKKMDLQIQSKLISLVFLLVLCGCANPKQIMVNPNNWQQVNCSAHGWGWIGAPQALSISEKCINNQKVLGYITIEEAEMQDPPKFTGAASTSQAQIDKPVWSANSFWEYTVNGNSTKIIVEKVDSFSGSKAYFVNNGNNINILNDALGLLAVMQNNVMDSSYDPALQPFDWPLFVGKKWDSAGKMIRNGGAIDLSTHHEVKGYGKVKVPAGEFDAFYILSRSDYGARITELWYSPEIKYYVKGVTYTNSGKSVEELNSYQLK